MSGDRAENIVDCPMDNCDARFDAVGASYVGAKPACPGCGATWKELCGAVEPDDGDDAELEYPFDGPGGVRA